MSPCKTPDLLTVLVFVSLFAWSLPAAGEDPPGVAETTATQLCSDGISSSLEGIAGGEAPAPEPALTSCGPCLLEFCPEVGVRCNFTQCDLRACCPYACSCDPTCVNTGTPSNVCGLAIPCCGDVCPNGVRECAEVCDGADLGGTTCVDLGFDGGTLACNQFCSGFDTSGCFKCGNGVKEGPEVCDGADLGGTTCPDLGFDGGTLACLGDCSGFDTSDCRECPNDTCADCEGQQKGNPARRFCCGNGIEEPEEGDCSICDGNC